MIHVLTCRRLLLSTLVLSVLLAGCGKTVDRRMADMQEKMAFKVGDRWLVRPPHNINATRVEVTREIMTPAETEDGTMVMDVRSQVLRLDLTTGRAVFEADDGRVYPQQINAEDVRKIHRLIADRDWQVRGIRPAGDAQSYTEYQLTVYEIDQAQKDRPIWYVPADGELPELFTVLVNTFDVAHRYAYPLSEDVNLLH